MAKSEREVLQETHELWTELNGLANEHRGDWRVFSRMLELGQSRRIRGVDLGPGWEMGEGIDGNKTFFKPRYRIGGIDALKGEMGVVLAAGKESCAIFLDGIYDFELNPGVIWEEACEEMASWLVSQLRQSEEFGSAGLDLRNGEVVLTLTSDRVDGKVGVEVCVIVDRGIMLRLCEREDLTLTEIGGGRINKV